LHQVKGADFEAVDVQALMLHPNSSQVRPSLKDVIQLLQVLAGVAVNPSVCDIEGDNRQGLAEVLNALQLLADHP
jgi:hypothetical protein